MFIFNKKYIELAYQILDGIPEKQISLDYTYNEYVQEGDWDKIIACGAGWLALHPKFQKLGLYSISTEFVVGLIQKKYLNYIRNYKKTKLKINSYNPLFNDLGRLFYSPKVDANIGQYSNIRVDDIFCVKGEGLWDKNLIDKIKKETNSRKVSAKQLLLERLKFAYNHCSV